MTPAEKLAHHLTQRPEMPRPYDPDSAIAIAWQRAMQWFVDTREKLEAEIRRDELQKMVFVRKAPSVTPRADYIYREPLKRRRRAA